MISLKIRDLKKQHHNSFKIIREKAENQHIISSSSTAIDDIQDLEMHNETIASDPPDSETLDRTNTKDSASSNETNAISEKIIMKLKELKHQGLFDRIELPKIRKDRKVKELIHKGNTAIGKLKAEILEHLEITEINQLIHATASMITEDLGVTMNKKKAQKYKQPRWKERISKDIECLRRKL